MGEIGPIDFVRDATLILITGDQRGGIASLAASVNTLLAGCSLTLMGSVLYMQRASGSALIWTNRSRFNEVTVSVRLRDATGPTKQRDFATSITNGRGMAVT